MANGSYSRLIGWINQRGLLIHIYHDNANKAIIDHQLDAPTVSPFLRETNKFEAQHGTNDCGPVNQT